MPINSPEKITNYYSRGQMLLCVFLLIHSTVGHSEVVTIAISGNFTGPDKTLWNPARNYLRNAAKLALEDSSPRLKEKGIELKLKEFDLTSDRNQILPVAEEIAKSKVNAVFGFPLSSEALLAAPIFQAANIPFLTPSGSADRLAKIGGFVHTANFSNAAQAHVLVDLVKQTEPRKIAMVTVADCAYCQSLRSAIKSQLSTFALPLTIDEAYLSTNRDMRELVSKLKAVDPDVVFIPNYEWDSAELISQLLDAGVHPKLWVGCSAWAGLSGAFTQLVKDRDIRSLVVNLWHKDLKLPNAVAFGRKYRKRFGTEAHDVAVTAYDGMMVMIEGILRAPSYSRAGIEVGLTKLTAAKSVLGEIRYEAGNKFPTRPVVALFFRGSHLQRYQIKLAK